MRVTSLSTSNSSDPCPSHCFSVIELPPPIVSLFSLTFWSPSVQPRRPSVILMLSSTLCSSSSPSTATQSTKLPHQWSSPPPKSPPPLSPSHHHLKDCLLIGFLFLHIAGPASPPFALAIVVLAAGQCPLFLSQFLSLTKSPCHRPPQHPCLDGILISIFSVVLVST